MPFNAAALTTLQRPETPLPSLVKLERHLGTLREFLARTLPSFTVRKKTLPHPSVAL